MHFLTIGHQPSTRADNGENPAIQRSPCTLTSAFLGTGDGFIDSHIERRHFAFERPGG
jgi:hypothetical protein